MSAVPTLLAALASAGPLPAPADEAAVAVGLARWSESAANSDADLAGFMRDLAADGTGRALLATLFGNSSFLTQCCLDEPGFVRSLVADGADATIDRLLAPASPVTRQPLARDAVMAELRRLRRRTALTVAIADIGGLWPLERVTRALSEFADLVLGAATRHLLAAAASDGEIEAPSGDDPAVGSGFIVLGMGKLGAFELNYSSDVDLILLYDAERVRYRGRRDVQHFFTRLAHELVRVLGERTGDGYVCRVDLRLRPDPASTPPVVSRAAADAYYEGAGQNWERAAFIKARPVAGDIAAGGDFISDLAPFLWRRNLDFAAIQDIHSIKRQIDAHQGGGIALAGHNVKLGRGGIREIEFFAQTQQLIWGGRVPELRAHATCDALGALAATHHISDDAATELAECYRMLRRVEHRLQMVADAQTHSLPEDAEGLRRIAVFLGYPDRETFDRELSRRLALVETHYARLFREAPPLAARGNLVFTGFEDDPDTLKTLESMGFANPSAVAAIVRGWHHGRYRAMRSQRAREILTELIPTLLQEFGAAAEPDTAFVRFDRFLERLPAGVQLLSLFTNNPSLVALVAEIMASGPRLADEIARRPGHLDAVLSEGFFDPPPPLATLAAEFDRMLDRARHYEDLLDLARRWVGERKFQLGVQILRRRIDGEQAGTAFADIAEAAMSRLLPRVAAEFAKTHGAVSGGELVVLGLGKLGSREMTVTSDLDLIIVYDVPDGVETSDGPRPLAVAAYYARLTQRFINALTALTSEGNLYEVDMRLRPSGTQGPLATSFAAFRKYHDESAWTWEHMSLTRARMVTGSPGLGQRVATAAHEMLLQSRDPDRLLVDVDDMRRRIADAHRTPGPLDLKHRRGGMVDIEFIAQYLQLSAAATNANILRQNTQAALKALADSDVLAREAAVALAASLALWRDLQGVLKLILDEPFDEAQAAPALRVALAPGAGAFDFAELMVRIERAAEGAHDWYDRLIAEPAAAARERLARSQAQEEHAHEH